MFGSRDNCKNHYIAIKPWWITIIGSNIEQKLAGQVCAAANVETNMVKVEGEKLIEGKNRDKVVDEGKQVLKKW